MSLNCSFKSNFENIFPNMNCWSAWLNILRTRSSGYTCNDRLLIYPPLDSLDATLYWNLYYQEEQMLDATCAQVIRLVKDKEEDGIGKLKKCMNNFFRILARQNKN